MSNKYSEIRFMKTEVNEQTVYTLFLNVELLVNYFTLWMKPDAKISVSACLAAQVFVLSF